MVDAPSSVSPWHHGCKHWLSLRPHTCEVMYVFLHTWRNLYTISVCGSKISAAWCMAITRLSLSMSWHITQEGGGERGGSMGVDMLFLI